jgi:hypothetical protein
MRILTVLIVALGVAVAVAPAAEARKYCGKVTTKYSETSIFKHKTYVIKGSLGCKTVRRVMKESIPADKDTKGWTCVQIHQRPEYAAYDVTCKKGKVVLGAITEL